LRYSLVNGLQPDKLNHHHVMSSTANANDFTDSVGAFLMLTRAGKLDAIDGVQISDTGVEIQQAGLELSVLSPLVSKIRRSNLSIALERGEQPTAQFKMHVKMGPSTKIMNALGNKTELLSPSLDNASLPIVVQADLEAQVEEHLKANPAARLHVPLRSLGVREHLPREIERLLRELVLSNATEGAPKSKGLTDYLRAIRLELRATVLRDYMMKCIWLNPKTSQLGNIVEDSGTVRFQPFDADDPEIIAFLCALEKDPFGDFNLDFREFANVEPTPKRANPWLGPSVHIYKQDFRTENKLEEYYSLYSGFRALAGVGTPVLIYEGQNPLIEQTAIRFLKVSDRSINLLQGNLLKGNLLQEGVREFTAQALVWKD
jgi:hypothetical protein